MSKKIVKNPQEKQKPDGNVGQLIHEESRAKLKSLQSPEALAVNPDQVGPDWYSFRIYELALAGGLCNLFYVCHFEPQYTLPRTLCGDPETQSGLRRFERDRTVMSPLQLSMVAGYMSDSCSLSRKMLVGDADLVKLIPKLGDALTGESTRTYLFDEVVQAYNESTDESLTREQKQGLRERFSR